MKVTLQVSLALLFVIQLSETSVIYDQVCIRNIGCDTELQDMIFGVSFELLSKSGTYLYAT